MRETQILRGLGKARMKQSPKVLHAAGGFLDGWLGGADTADSMYAAADEATKKAQSQRFAAQTAATLQSQQQEMARRNAARDAQRMFPSMAGSFSNSQANPAHTVPNGTGNALRAADAAGSVLPATGAGGGQGMRGVQPAAPAAPQPAATGLDRAGFLARNPGVIANQTLSPSAPVAATAPTAPTMLQTSPNSFGDLTNPNGSALTSTKTLPGSGMSMQAWSAPGRSNGQPNAENDAAMGAIAGGLGAARQDAFDRRSNGMDPLGASGRGMKAAQFSRGVAQLKGPGTATSDSIPAMLSKGEAVLPAKTVQAIGPAKIAATIKATTGKAPKGGLRAGGHYALGELGQTPVPGVETGTADMADFQIAQKQAAARAALNAPTIGPQAPSSAATAAEDAATLRQFNNIKAQNAGIGSNYTGPQGAAASAEAPAAGGLRGRVTSVFNSAKNFVTGAPTAAPEAAAGTTKGLAGKAAGFAARTLLAAAPVAGAVKTASATPEEHAQFADSVGMDKNGMGSRALEFLNNTGNAATLGLAGALGRGISNVANGGHFFDPETNATATAAQTATPAGVAADGNGATATTAQPAAAGPKAGDTRDVNYDGILHPDGVMDQFNGKVWQTVSTPQSKAARTLADGQRQQQLEHSADVAANGPSGYNTQLANLQKLNGSGEDQFAGLGPAHRAQMMLEQSRINSGLKAANIQADASRYNTDSQAKTALGAQGVDVRGQDLTYAGKNRQLAYDMLVRNHDWTREGAKDLQDELKNSPFATVRDDKGVASQSDSEAANIAQFMGATPWTDKNGRQISMGRLRNEDPARFDALKTAAMTKYGINRAANSYLGGTLFGEHTGWGDVKINDIRDGRASDFGEGTGLGKAALYGTGLAKNTKYGKVVEVEANGVRKAVPLDTFINDPQNGGQYKKYFQQWQTQHGRSALGGDLTGGN